MKTKDLISVIFGSALLCLVSGCGGGGDEFAQPTKQLGPQNAGETKKAAPEPEKPVAPVAAAPASAVQTSSDGPGIGLFAAPEAAPAGPVEVDGIAVAPAVSGDDGLSADLSSDGRLLVAERGDGRFGVYEVNRRINLMSLKAAENNIKRLAFDDKKGLITAILPSGKIQVWKYQSTIGLDRFAKEAIANDSFLRGFEGHAGGTLGLGVSPSRDEMVTVGVDGQLRFWRINESTSTRPFEQSGNEIQHLVLGIDGSFAAALTARGIVTIWETASGKARTMPIGDRAVTCVAIDSKGSLLAAGDSTGNVVLLEVSNGRTHELSLGRQSVVDVRFEEESQRLFAITVDGETRAWNLPLSSATTIEGLTAAGGLMAVSSDSNRVATLNRQGRLRLVSLAGDAAVQELATSLEKVTAVEYAAGDSVVVGNEGGQVEIQESSGLKKFIAIGDAAISQLKWSSDGLLATLDKQGTSSIWSTGGSQLTTRFSDETVVASASDTASAALAIALRSGRQVVVDLANGETLATRQSNDEAVTSAALDARRGMVVFGYTSGKVSLWLFREKSDLISLGQHAVAVTHLGISESGEFVYSAAGDGTVCSWPTQVKDTAPTLDKLSGKIRIAEFASNQPIGVAATDTGLYAVDLRSGTARELSGLAQPERIRISADGSQFAAMTADGNVALHRVADGKLLRQHMATDQIVDLGFLNSTKSYVSLDAKGAIRRWSRPESELALVSESLKGASRIWLNPSGSILAVAAEEKSIRFLAVAEDFKLLSTVTVDDGVNLLAWIGDQNCAVTSPGKNSVSLVEVQGGRVRKALVQLPGAASIFCRRPDNGELLAVSGTRLVKIRPVSGDIRVNEISFKASDKDQIVNCGQTTLLLSGSRLFRIGRNDTVVVDERVANVKALSGSLSERSAVLITESGNMLAFFDNKFTDAGVNPLPNSNVSISDDGEYLWIQPATGEGMVWSVRKKKSVQKVSFAGNAALRSWLPEQRGLVQVDTSGGVSVLGNLVTSEWETGVANARSISVSSAGTRALVRGAGSEAVVLDLRNEQARSIQLTDPIFAEITDEEGTVVAVSNSGKVDRIAESGVKTQQLDGPVRSVSIDRINRTLAMLYSTDKCGLISIDEMSDVQPMPGGLDHNLMYSTSMGYLLSNDQGGLKFAERVVLQSSGMPKPGHKGGCTGLTVFQGKIMTSGRDGVIRSWSTDLSNHSDIFKHSRSIDSMNVSQETQQITACDEIGEIIVLSPEGQNGNGTKRVGMGPGSKTFGQDADGNLLIGNTRQMMRFRSDGALRDGVQFKEDCVQIGKLGSDGKWFALEKNGDLFSFDFVSQRHSIQRAAKISALHWARASQLAVVSGKQVEILSASGDVLANANVDTEIVASGMSPNGQHLAVLSVSGELSLFDAQLLAKTSSFRPGIAANRIAVGLTGETVLLFGVDATEEWSAKGTRLRRLSVSGVFSASYVEGAPFLITALKNGEVRQWPQQQMFSNRPTSIVKDCRLLPQGSGAVFVDDKGFASAESADSKVFWKSKEPVLDIRKASFSRDGSLAVLLTGSNGMRYASIYDRKTGFVKQFEIPASCSDIQLSPDGVSVLLVLEKSVEIRNVDTGLVTQLINITARKCFYVTSNSLIFVDNLGVLRIAATGDLGTMQITSGEGTAVTYDETGDRLATGTSEGVVTVWDRSTSELKKLHEFSTESPVRQVLLRGSLLIARTDLAVVSVWLIGAANSSASQSLSFTHVSVPKLIQIDGKQELLATVSAENEVSVWDLASRSAAAKKVLSLTGHDQQVTALSFTDTSESLVTLDAAGTVSVNPLPNIATLRQKANAEVMERQSSGFLEELSLTLTGSGRTGNDSASRRLLQEDAVRRDLQTLRSERQDDPGPAIGNNGIHQNLVERMMSARSSQYEGVYQEQFVESGGEGPKFPSAKERKWSPPAELVADFQSVKSLPSEIAAAAGGESGNQESSTSTTSSGTRNSADELVRKLVATQRSFVRQLSGGALNGLMGSDSGSPQDQATRENIRRQLEQMSDSRTIQTIPTRYRFPNGRAADEVRVALQISSDGSTVAACFPPIDAETAKGSLDVWDMLSGIPLKQFETTEGVQEMYLSTIEDQLLTTPAVSTYRLYDNLPPRYLTHATSNSWHRAAENPLVAFTRRVTIDSQERLLAIYNAKSFDSVPVSMPEGFDTQATAVAFGNKDDKLAFAVSERGKDHKLFVCRMADLSRFEILTPIDVIDGRNFSKPLGGLGFPSLVFSADDQTLLAVAQGSDGTEGFSVRSYSLNDERWKLTAVMPLPKEAFGDVGDRIAISFVGQLPRVSITTRLGTFVGDMQSARKKQSQSVWGIPFDPETTRVAKLSEDGRWLAIGMSNGAIAIHDLSSADPAVSVPVPSEGDAAHDGPVIGLSFSRPMQGTTVPTYLASFGRENRLKVWALVDVKEQFPKAKRKR